MAIHIQSGKNDIQTNPKFSNNIHSMPFKIHADCDAQISKYFLQTPIEKEILSASFRGHPLLGKEIQIPAGYRGVVLHETMKPATEKEDRKFYVIHTFDKFKYWNWEKAPSKNDPLVQAMDWIDIAEALHSPVVEE
ncbi:hypothetical protein WA026_000643 [Henosepilachna vigintioctopunctata]|uniref:Uncharacterized protein n=1 Tax=Henosepilachna vigintioctopunctata TaxID=420089 RepID=A0AAW1V7W2_9CUCU